MNKGQKNKREQGPDYSVERIIKMAKPYREPLHLIMTDFRMDNTHRALVLAHLKDVIQGMQEINEIERKKSEAQDG